MELKDRLRELRGDISQIECANRIGVSITNYGKWEQGTQPKISILSQIADYYGVTLDYLVGRTDYIDPQYEQTVSDTGLTENALKGLQFIRETSTEQLNLFKALNFLLEQEIKPINQKELKECMHHDVPTPFRSLSLPDALSALLLYMEYDDKNQTQLFLQTIKTQLPEEAYRQVVETLIPSDMNNEMAISFVLSSLLKSYKVQRS